MRMNNLSLFPSFFFIVLVHYVVYAYNYRNHSDLFVGIVS